MKTELLLFNGLPDSWECFKRGLIATITLIILYFILLSILKYLGTELNINIQTIIFGIFICILLGSAIAVQNPKNLSEAIVYSALVGFTVYAIFNLMLIIMSSKMFILRSILYTLWGTIICIIASIMVYFIYTIHYLKNNK